MSWVAVNQNGQEVILPNIPHRFEFKMSGVGDIWEDEYALCCDECQDGMCYYNASVDLPKGSIKKLIGRDLTWEDEPVELREG